MKSQGIARLVWIDHLMTMNGVCQITLHVIYLSIYLSDRDISVMTKVVAQNYYLS